MADEEPDTLQATAVVVSPRGGSGLSEKPSVAESARRTRKRSGLYRRGGRRDVKEYPLTFTELLGLGGLGLLASGMFAGGSFFLSTWWQVGQDFAFSPPADPKTAAFWHGVQSVSLVAAIVLYVAGLIAMALGGTAIARIMHETGHED